MRSRKILIFYLVSLSSFILTTFFYSPRPRLNQFSTKLDNNDEVDVKKIYLNKDNISNRIKRRINIGKSYLMIIGEEVSLNITYLSFSNKKDFNLSYYAKYLPEILIDKDEINVVNKNNYGVKNLEFSKKYQACVFNLNPPSFLYKYNYDKKTYRYDNYEHWFQVIKREIRDLFRDPRIKNYNCLLITTSNPQIFENEMKDILKIISNNFVFE